MVADPIAYALDSFALLAYLEGEVGKPRIKQLFKDAVSGSCFLYLSIINLGEVLYITERERSLFAAQRTLAAVDQLPIRIVNCTRATVLAAAHIKARYPISYPDAFAVVTAQDRHSVLLTGDPEFRSVADDRLVAIEWLPR